MKRIAVALALAVLSSGALAQTAPAPVPATAAPVAPVTPQAPKIDPTREMLAEKILTETHAQDNMKAVMDTMTPILLASIRRQAPTVSDGTFKLIAQMLPQELQLQLPRLAALEAAVYAEHFTLDELTAIDGFYQSEAGQKVITETPKILKETLPMGAVWGREAATQAMQDVVKKLRAQGVKI